MIHIMNLLEETLKLIDETVYSRREICEMAGVDIEWLNKVAQRRILDPGVNRLQKVYDALKKD